jgi:N-acetylmuramoyl-L-alanine amidase
MPVYPANTKNYGNTPNNSGRFKSGEPRFLVMHYTASGAGKASADYLFKPHQPASSAHFVVDRNGDVFQLADTGLVTWHAGKSLWRGIQYLNSHSIGIEFANWGYWRPKIQPATVAAAEKAGWLKARHKNGGPELLWEPYPEPQILAGTELTRWLLHTHPTIKEIVGHDDIAPGRKSDPGPLLQPFRYVLWPDADIEPLERRDRLKVNASSLNMRGGPGTTFEVLRSLKRGAVVTVVQDKGEWSFVEDSDGQGWVFDQYLTPA